MLTFRCLATMPLVVGGLACSSLPGPPSGSGGSSSGGSASGGSAAGGDAAGGSSSGGSAAGGSGATSSGGAATGGASSGGAGTGGSSGGGSGGPFEISAHLASEEDELAPTTVGIVEWSTSLGAPTEATVEFGLSTEYGQVAPVDLAAPEWRTVLLGMKPEQTYHFRIVATVAGQQVTSDDQTLSTGAGPDASLIDVARYEVLDEAAREPGFLLLSQWGTDSAGRVFILDADGDIVWWFYPEIMGGVGKAALSADGRDIWMISTDFGGGGEPLVRVGIDGLGAESYPPGSGGSHDIIPVEGDVMAFIDYDPSDGKNGVVEIDSAGQTTEVLAMSTLFDSTSGEVLQHPNALFYDAGSATYYLSSRDIDVYRFPRAGGTPENLEALSTMLGDREEWGGVQHGIQLLPDDHLLLLANQGAGASESAALEFDLASGTEVWRYDSGEYTAHFGDVQRLPGGNTLLTISNSGILQEVAPDETRVLEIEIAPQLGYATWLQSLYPE